MKHRFPPDCPKRLRDLIGRKVRARDEMANNLMSIPAGAILTVEYSIRWEKLRLKGPACACCGVAAVITADIASVTMAAEADLLAAE